jgi:uncharacterized protein YdcH (DUF465 family)
MKKMSLLALLLFYYMSIFGQNKYLLEGKIGVYPIVMKVEESLNFFNGNNIYVSYYYKQDMHDIELDGHATGSAKYVFEKEQQNSKTNEVELAEKFVLERLPDKTWKGKWINKSKELPVSLHSIDTLNNSFNRLPYFEYHDNVDRMYSGIRFNDLQFVNDSITRMGKFQLQWNHEIHSKIVSFAVVNGANDIVLKRINSSLRKKQYSYIDDLYSCTSAHTYNGDYSYHLISYFITDNFLSINGSLFNICGGAHPDFGEENIIVNMKTGEEIKDLDNLFWFTGKKPVDDKSVDYYKYAEERAKSIMNILTELYPEQMKKQKSKDDCDYSNSEVWNFPSWYLSPKGLYVGASFAMVARVCDSPGFSFIPYDILRNFVRKDQQIQLP